MKKLLFFIMFLACISVYGQDSTYISYKDLYGYMKECYSDSINITIEELYYNDALSRVYSLPDEPSFYKYPVMKKRKYWIHRTATLEGFINYLNQKP